MVPLALFGTLGATEIFLILLIVVVLFGARRIPDLARGLGEGIRNFRSSVKETEADDPKDDKHDSSGESDR